MFDYVILLLEPISLSSLRCFFAILFPLFYRCRGFEEQGERWFVNFVVSSGEPPISFNVDIALTINFRPIVPPNSVQRSCSADKSVDNSLIAKVHDLHLHFLRALYLS
jgi:hypothetical protein